MEESILTIYGMRFWNYTGIAPDGTNCGINIFNIIKGENSKSLEEK